MENDFPELPSQYQVNDKVYGSIEDQSEMIEAGQAEEPGRGEEGGPAPVIIWVMDFLSYIWYSPEEIFSHEELVAVEKDSRNVTTDEHKDNADENEGKVDLSADRTCCPQMRKSMNIDLIRKKLFSW